MAYLVCNHMEQLISRFFFLSLMKYTDDAMFFIRCETLCFFSKVVKLWLDFSFCLLALCHSALWGLVIVALSVPFSFVWQSLSFSNIFNLTAALMQVVNWAYVHCCLGRSYWSSPRGFRWRRVISRWWHCRDFRSCLEIKKKKTWIINKAKEIL